MERRIWITLLITLCIWYSTFFWIFLKKHGEKTDNPLIRIWVNKITNRTTFKIKTGYHLKYFILEAIKLIGNTKNEINKDENGENGPHLELIGIILVHCNILNKGYQQNARVLYTFNSNKSFCQLLDISPKLFLFLKPFHSEF